MLPWVVRDLASDAIVAPPATHDIVSAIDRVEIGYTCTLRVVQRRDQYT